MNVAMRSLPDEFHLSSGAHSPGAEMCLLEAVAFVAGEAWTDSPTCTSRVIAAFLRRWNDDMNDEDRQILKRFFVRGADGIWTSPLIGTAAGPEIERQRAYMAADWSSRTAVPRWLRACGAVDEAAKLEALSPVVDAATARSATTALRSARDVANELRDRHQREFNERLRAAGVAGAAWDAWVAGAAWAAWAAWDAWVAGAAGVALIEKLKAANATTYAEAYPIARAHFDELFATTLRPVVVELQQSALELVDRMVACGTEDA